MAEEAVGRQTEKHAKVLAVQSVYEPSRLKVECLAGAYERAVPILRRAALPAGKGDRVVGRRTLRQAGGRGA